MHKVSLDIVDKNVNINLVLVLLTIEGRFQMTESNLQKATLVVPGYFDAIYSDLIKKGVLKDQLQDLIPMMATLQKMRCKRETIETLCVRGNFFSLEELKRARCSANTYRDIGIVEYQQRHLLVNIVKNLNHPPVKKDSITVEVFIKRVLNMALQASQKNRESLPG